MSALKKKQMDNMSDDILNLPDDLREVEEKLLAVMDSQNYFSPLDWFVKKGIYVPDKNLLTSVEFQSLPEVLNRDCPFTDGKKLKETHGLFCKPEILFPDSRYFWFLVFKGVLPGSCDKFFSSQEEMIPENYEVASRANYTLMNSLFVLKNSIDMIDNIKKGRVSDKDRDGHPMTINLCQQFEDSFIYHYANYLSKNIGILVKRNLI